MGEGAREEAVRRVALVLALAAVAAVVACGVKAPPRPPLREAPDAGTSTSTPTLPPDGGAP